MTCSHGCDWEKKLAVDAFQKLGMIAVDASKTASVASMTCVEEWTDFQNFHVVNLCNPALNGIRTASERPLNGILSGSGGTPQER